jgi:DNA-directed RNA polymerase specialized sigma24 family protein
MKPASARQQIGMNQEKFEELFSKYGKSVFRTAYGATGNEADAYDIQQNVFVRLIDTGNTCWQALENALFYPRRRCRVLSIIASALPRLFPRRMYAA